MTVSEKDPNPSFEESLSDLVATMKACGSYRDVKVISKGDWTAELEAEWINTNYGRTPETLEKIRLTVKF